MFFSEKILPLPLYSFILSKRNMKRNLFSVTTGYMMLFFVMIYLLLFRHSVALWGFKFNSILIFVISIGFLIFSLLKRKNNETPSFSFKWHNVIPIWVLGWIACYKYLGNLIAPFPMDKTQSDVIPQMQTLVRRFLSGTNVYESINFDTYTLFPTYLPLQWLPFSIAEKMHVDYRVFALFALFIVFLFFIKTIKQEYYDILLAILPLALTHFAFWKNDANYYNCVENLMAAYYMAFAVSLVQSKKVWLQAILFSCCLLSRYSIVLWTPLFFLYLYFNYSLKEALKAAGIIAGVVLVVYILPFFIKDTSIFLQGYQYHTGAALGEWTTPSWSNNGYPFHLSSGIGFAAFFHSSVVENLPSQLAISQKVHLLMSLLSILISVAIAWYRWKKYSLKPDSYFALWTLAFYLTVFYHFIQIPYNYLFVVPIYVYVVLFKEGVERG
jgi:hypothetical protein